MCNSLPALYGSVRLGVGTGIQSYPRDFDPFHTMDRLPLLYPQGEIGLSVSDHVSIAVTLSRVKMYGELVPLLSAAQSMTLITGGLCVEYDLLSGSDMFGLGLQTQSVIGIVRIADMGEYENGWGCKLYAVVRQPLLEMISLGVRTGAQRVVVRARSMFVDEELILDSFTIDIMVYVRL